jgi:hypothetical protein
MAPDLLITTNYGSSKGRKVVDGRTVFQNDGIFIEVKARESWDLPFMLSDPETTTHFRSSLTIDQKSLLLQIIRYVSIGQFPTLPYDKVYLITVTGTKLRVWRFSPNGIQVTEAVAYLEDARPLVKFLLAVSKNGKAGMGLNIGRNGLFKEVDLGKSDSVARRIEKLAKLYADKANDPRWLKSFRIRQAGLWELNMHQGEKMSEDCPNRLLVFQVPIHYTTGMFSRGTRCYLVVSAQLLYSSVFDILDETKYLEGMHVLKISWQWDYRTPEINFFREYRRRYDKEPPSFKSDNSPLGIATPLVGGQSTRPVDLPIYPSELSPDEVDELPSTDADAEDSDMSEDDDDDGNLHYGFSEEALKNVHPKIRRGRDQPLNQEQTVKRTLNWIVFKEIGAKLVHANNSQELVRVIVDAMGGACSFKFRVILPHSSI